MLCCEPIVANSAGRKNGQDSRWLQQVRRSGTTSDKVAALTLLLQESAVANLKSLDALLNWVIKRKGGRNVVAQVHVTLCLHTSSKIDDLLSIGMGAQAYICSDPVWHHLMCEADNFFHCAAILQCFGSAYVYCVILDFLVLPAFVSSN